MFAQVLARRALHTSRPLLSAQPGLEATLRNALKASMKAKDKPAAACLKSILADVTNATKSGANPNEPINDEGVMGVLKKGISQRTQASESYSPTSPSPHPENYSSLLNEINLLKSFLPEAPSNEILQQSIDKIITGLTDELKASRGVAGQILNKLWEELGDKKAGVDKKLAGKMVQEALKKLQI
ncbi:hypothetical protein L486_04336 [Kwoniella mangroviensis CBS 10435]|uniref:Altered inheritance of mitochondria protein 41 n=1 Tax=Kwoniella mangroviensis CBS 10435 TaxID=1331196 RepID=A0A1B9IRY5_9TREE|nr:uncharacterized protein I203_02572 [Kwoniella mangroviensis CBS 8507]OCF58305.1 hypothetical protein L486_04336 [Kwoniella mangroviensis CBS 10435]OCF67914.1 hypothetical protein I203_02572 [Kwoniella mangroviensis CBS 8507]